MMNFGDERLNQLGIIEINIHFYHIDVMNILHVYFRVLFKLCQDKLIG